MISFGNENRLHEEGQADYLAAVAHFKAKSRARGAAFATEFRAAMATIIAFPQSCRADHRGVRKKRSRDPSTFSCIESMTRTSSRYTP